jgi:hypothetical protein
MVSLCAFTAAAAAQISASPSPIGDGSFMVEGSVLNSVTGEPIANSLVRMDGSAQRTAFSDAKGHFEFDGLPALPGGSLIVTAEKAGYYSQQNSRGANWLREFVARTSSTDALVLKLTPESTISGRIMDLMGEPIGRLPVQMKFEVLDRGSAHWHTGREQQTDEEGRYSFANLRPGTYCVVTRPRIAEPHNGAGIETPKTDYPSMYYPGVSDMASASTIHLTAGQHAEADFSLPLRPVYQVSGIITPAQAPMELRFFSSSGESLWFPVQLNAQTGHFEVAGVFADNYVVKAASRTGPDEILRAETEVNVVGDTNEVRLVLQPSLFIPVNVTLESRAPQKRPMSGVPMSVGLIPSDPTSSTYDSTSASDSSGAYSVFLQNVEPGKYSVELTPQSWWYVASAHYGATNLLYDDVTVASADHGRPIDVVLRDDGATLTVTRKPPVAAGTMAAIVVVPQRKSKLAPKIAGTYSTNPAVLMGLAPGAYLVYAFDSVDTIEYSNPDILQKYASRAAQITLSPNQIAEVAVEVILTTDAD